MNSTNTHANISAIKKGSIMENGFARLLGRRRTPDTRTTVLDALGGQTRLLQVDHPEDLSNVHFLLLDAVTNYGATTPQGRTLIEAAGLVHDLFRTWRWRGTDPAARVAAHRCLAALAYSEHPLTRFSPEGDHARAWIDYISQLPLRACCGTWAISS
ncbi:hypothetical protein Ae717Ps2_6742 [Pseudonocardia sp. Ae717_Ps2]|uniref:hypothetical protein n=1 Tax=Pseudonocardia sp. Ae717_Ps2 TaxID=1885573 RepID=UPI00094AD5FA|nr:hypothetical protein [Pseudonocardia sp. Ae717_Ps2]OLM27902.1 hypothetical protein Ae717Ps2_7120 [Pseudonocardia sp. Ae717_Ps2]OLM28089.1 hypothetical protein Ae717Ps2_6828c [Pseudonocardia sp. Ae717_Ps2]OLM28114.1 hypothetical protein Ae717Ps2_6742 [Pseudonocardia sp. Ae717_Ps2]